MLVLVGGPTPAARADEESEKYEKMARKAYAAKRYEDAIAAFEAAYDADPLPKYLFNAGRSYQKLGNLAKAVHYFERYLEEEPDAKDREDVELLAEVTRKKLEKTHSQLKVWSKPGGALVQVEGVDGKTTGKTPFARYLPFGSYDVTVSKSGARGSARGVVVKPGEPTAVKLELASVGDGKKKRKKRRKKRAVEPRGGGGAGRLPWAVVGGGAALVAGGAIFGALGSQAEQERDDLLSTAVDKDQAAAQEAKAKEQDDLARSRSLIANGLYVAGGAAVVAGVVWWALAGDGQEASVGLQPLPGGVGLVVGGPF